jgi:hypothetical protein
LPDVPVREGQDRRVVAGLGGGMVRAPAKEREHHVPALVEELEGPHSSRRRMVGDEEDRFQRRASS